MTVECDAGYTGGGGVTCLDTGNWGTIPACNTRGKLLSMMAQRKWSVMLDTLVEVVSRAWIPGTGVLYRHVTLEVSYSL